MINKQSSAIQNKWAVDPRCVLLLHCDGENNGTTFIDSSPSPKTITAYGNVKTVNTVRRLGNASAAFDGTGDYLSTPGQLSDFNFGSGAWTISYWIKKNANGLAGQLTYGDNAGSATTSWLIYNNGSNFIELDFFVGTTGYNVYSASALTDLISYHHVAVICSGTTMIIYLDGVGGTPVAFTGSLNYPNKPIVIGQLGSANYWYNGNIDEIAIWKGVAISITDLYPQRTPFYDYALSEPQGV